MLKAYFMKTPSMFLSQIIFNHKKISTLQQRDGFKQFIILNGINVLSKTNNNYPRDYLNIYI